MSPPALDVDQDSSDELEIALHYCSGLVAGPALIEDLAPDDRIDDLAAKNFFCWNRYDVLRLAEQFRMG